MALSRWIARAAEAGRRRAHRAAARRAAAGPAWLAVREDAAPAAAGGRGTLLQWNGMSLTELSPGEEALIRSVSGSSASRLGRLSSFGLAPGARVKLIQKKPAVVVEVGGTRLALEAEIAATIGVAPDARKR